jgi:hypothetical protein
VKRIVPSGRHPSKTVLGWVIALMVLMLSACNEDTIRQLGAKLAISGQSASNSAVTALNNVDGLEAIDYQQQGLIKIVTLPPDLLKPLPPNTDPRIVLRRSNDINSLIVVKHNDQLSSEIAGRIKAYKLFGKAYASLQRLSETKFADTTATAEGNLISAFNAVKGLPDVPASVTSLIPDVSRIVINRKQAKDIKKANLLLLRLCQVYQELWEADRPVWDEFMTAVGNDYVKSLMSLPADRFDEKQLREQVKLPYPQPYLAYLYKNQEAARVDSAMRQIKDQLDSVDVALGMLVKSHKELDSEQPSFSDVIGTLDQMVTVLSDVKTLVKGDQK